MQVLAADGTVRLAADRFAFRPVGSMAFAEHPLRTFILYEMVAGAPTPAWIAAEAQEGYFAAFQHLQAGRTVEARPLLVACVAQSPEDPQPRRLLAAVNSEAGYTHSQQASLGAALQGLARLKPHRVAKRDARLQQK